jgi:hypothetical protein
MSTLYDPRVSAACLALREDPPAALDGPILQYARDVIAAQSEEQRRDPKRWRRRTFAAITAFIIVVSSASLWERANAPAPQRDRAPPSAPVAMTPVVVAPAAPAIVYTPSRTSLEATKPTVVAKTKAGPVAKKKVARALPPPDTAPLVLQESIEAPARSAPAVDGVQVKAISDDATLAPMPIAPAAPTPAVDATTPSTQACVADPTIAGCAPP